MRIRILCLPRMTLLAFLLGIGALPFAWFAEAADGDDSELARAIQLRKEYKEDEALRMLEKILAREPDNYQALLNAGYLHFRQGWLFSQVESEKQKLHYQKLEAYADRALALRPGEYQAKLLHLVAMAKNARFLPPGDQVKTARELDRELPDLIASATNDPTPLYILSWLNWKVGLVGSFERMLATMFFGGLPEDLTTDKAIALMQKAIELRSDYAVYFYDMGLFRRQLGQVDESRALFLKVLGMAPKTPEEAVYRKWAEERLEELAKNDGS